MSDTADFQFTSDWFTNRIPLWTDVFSSWAGKPYLRYLEIGCWEGRATCWMLENVLTHDTAKATVVDPFGTPYGSTQQGADGERREQWFWSNVSLVGAKHKVTAHKGHSQNLLPTLIGQTFDIIYIDGNHRADAVFTDTADCWRLLELNGIMIFDDVHMRPDRAEADRVEPAVQAFRECFDGLYTVVSDGYQLIIQKNEIGFHKIQDAISTAQPSHVQSAHGD